MNLIWSLVWDKYELSEITGVKCVFLMSPAGGEMELADWYSSGVCQVLSGHKKEHPPEEWEIQHGISTATLHINHNPGT